MLGVLLIPPLLGISPLAQSWLFLLPCLNSPLNPSIHQSMLPLLPLLFLFFFLSCTKSSSFCHHKSPLLLESSPLFFFLVSSSQNSSFHHSRGFLFFSFFILPSSKEAHHSSRFLCFFGSIFKLFMLSNLLSLELGETTFHSCLGLSLLISLPIHSIT
ncbi:hypothetical protein OIU78_015800 [Salix suchowensis]|nr:hypothetical protein OIU78_015800 [Salix suchowensis]